MAERLQKTLSVNPTVASVGTPIAGPDTSTAEAIGIAGDLAKTFTVEKKKSELKEGARELGEEVFAAQQGRELENASKRFRRLQQAKEQGKLSQTLVNIEAEKVLKESIGSFPAFAPELRQEAARILGFDPTGAETRALFDISEESRPKTLLEKIMEEADARTTLLGGNRMDHARDIARAQALKNQTEILKAEAALDRDKTTAFFNSSLEEQGEYLKDAMLDLRQQVVQEGGIKDPEAARATLTNHKESQWREIQSGFKAANVSASEQLQFRQVFDQKWEGAFDMVETGTMEHILTRRAKELSKGATIAGANLFPVTFVLQETGGQAHVDAFYGILPRITDKKQRALLKEQFPELGVFWDDEKSAHEIVMEGMQQVLGISPVDRTQTGAPGADGTQRGGNPRIEGNPAAGDVVSRVMIRSEDDEDVRQKVLREYIQPRGQFFKDLGDYAQKGARGLAIPEEVAHVKERWATEFNPLLARIAQGMEESTPGVFELQIEAGQVKIVDTRGPAGKIRIGSEGAPSVRGPGLQAEVTRLNAMNKLLQNGWASDIGEDPRNFLERTLRQIDNLRTRFSQAQEGEE